MKQLITRIKQLQCLKCKYVWIPRISERVKQCPNCKRMDWDEVKDGK